MPTITRIVQQKDQSRANIYLDGKFAFGVTLESLLTNNLHVNKQLTQSDITKLKDEDSVAKIYARAIDFCARRPRSGREIELWFKRKKVDEEVQKMIFPKLENLHLVNDLEFAKWWIDQRNTFRPKPVRVLKLELKTKGVKQEIIDEALESIESPSELEIAKKLAEKRLPRLKDLPFQDQKRKLAEFLGRRGFSWDVIKSVINRIYDGRL